MHSKPTNKQQSYLSANSTIGRVAVLDVLLSSFDDGDVAAHVALMSQSVKVQRDKWCWQAELSTLGFHRSCRHHPPCLV